MNELGLDRWIVKLCEKLNYTKPTSIQTQVVPAVLKGKNVIASAETGSGKTACFALPILQHLARDPFGIFALILTPNRELAYQIAEQVTMFGTSINIRCCCIVGGVDMLKQSLELQRVPHIVVATPGRLVDHIQKDYKLRDMLSMVRYLVMDEVDRLLDQSMGDDLDAILETLPKTRQTILTTATLTDAVFQNKDRLMGESKEVESFDVNRKVKTVEGLTQQFMLVPEDVKEFYFVELVRKFADHSMIIFLSTCRNCHTMSLLLQELGIHNACLHSYLPQTRRTINLKMFRNGRVNILLATDVASRGLDIQMVDLVINYDIPYDADDYIHRVGRTARKGKRGQAISIITQYDIGLIKNIEKEINEQLEPYEELKEKEVLDKMAEISKARKLVKIKMHESGLEEEFEKNQIYKKSIRKSNDANAVPSRDGQKAANGQETKKNNNRKIAIKAKPAASEPAQTKDI